MPIITNYLLFNHTYLRQLQADSSVDDEASIAAQGVREWYGFQDCTSTKALVQSWVAPMLQILELELQPYPQQVGACLSADRDSDAATYLLYTAWDHEKETPVGLCYVTPPGADLDTTTKGRHWMAQAVLAARNSPISNLQSPISTRWVILTNGDQWRLLDAQALRRYEAYLQVDLGELAQNPGDLSALRIFYRCFHRSAFAPSPSQGEGWGEGHEVAGLDRLLTASDRATKKAENHLKARVSHNEGIMARLCLGFVQATGRTRFTEAERDAIYRDATYLLYRMLFILYAEARGLLPMDNPAYQDVSISELIKIAYTHKLHGMPDPQATTLWERLKRLCTAIYESDETLGIPAYNGGLFDDADKPHLRKGSIADAYLTEALFDLVYRPGKVPGTLEVPGTSGYQPIDYHDLSVRHLGSLYEGMIEYRLQIAEETLWARRDKKGNVRFLRTGQEGAPRRTDVEIKPGDVYFSQNPGERRATGTYYTPEYIVDYIVRQTVVRGLEERRAPLEEKLSGWLEEIAAVPLGDGLRPSPERARMQRTADAELLRFVEEQVLTFRACDPAMGSGHFLVNAAHQMTAFIVETLHLTPWKNPAGDADPAAWRRRVVERCLYGVDLSLMAVELAKLSLWLASVAEGKPLSFLDHHLRQGNSLIGVRLEDLAEVLAGAVSTKPSRKECKAREAGQLSMLDDPAFSQHVTAATDLLAQISTRVVERVEDVKAQEADYEQMCTELEPYRRLAGLWTARHFGVGVDERQLRAISRYLVNGTVSPVPEYERILALTQELARERNFFHWGLEFPEIFLNERSWSQENSPGFDAVIGNPPYVNMDRVESLESKLLSLAYPDIWKGQADYLYFFVVRGVENLRNGGFFGYIAARYFIEAYFASGFRKFLQHNTSIISVVDFRNYTVFKNVGTKTCLLFLQRESDRNRRLANQVHTCLLTDRHVSDHHVTTALARHPLKTPFEQIGSSQTQLSPARWIFVPTNEANLTEKVDRLSWQLGDICRIGMGMQTGANDIFEVTPETIQRLNIEPQVLRKVVSNMEIQRYTFDYNDRYWIYTEPFGEQVPKLFPNIIEYLAKHRERLENRIAFRRGDCEWYQFSYPRHVDKYDSPKIVTPFIAPFNRFALDQIGDIYSSTDSQVIFPLEGFPVTLEYAVALLNSSLLNWRYRHLGKLKDYRYEYSRESLSVLPICRIDFSTPADEREQLAEEGQRQYDIYVTRRSQDCIVSFVELQLDQEPRRSDVVHDLLSYLAQQMIDLNKERRRLEREADLFRFVEQDTPCLRLDKALGGPLAAGEMVSDLSTIRHDIEGLRLSQEEDDRWLLEVRANLRDPESGWRKHQRDRDSKFIRQWLPVYRMPLDEATGRFYHYAFAHLRGFDGAGKFPGGYTRTALEKLNATKVPQFVPVDLAPLAALETELAEVRRRIRLTDDLIDQIVYKLYGLTEEEIAIVEGRA